MQTVVITGGAGGMGLATAKIMGRDHRVVIADLDERRLDAAAAGLEGLGIEAEAKVCDITDRASVDSLIAHANEHGGLRAVIHTAGVSPLMGSPELIIRINALGTVNITEASLAAATPGFALVNVASIAGHLYPKIMLPRRTFRLALTDAVRFTAKLTQSAKRGSEARRSGNAYSLGKAFVVWYSQRKAADFGAKGARLLSVSPGSFDTVMGRLEKKSGSERLVEYAALKRLGKPDEMAELLAFCASDKPGYLTGVDILCDGGTKAGLTLKNIAALAKGA
jgi:NAD(P)-dependent dehydrogenase (short-subunit alcohol dehydrogenase family)